MLLKLSDLPYTYDALSPSMSAETIELHHDKHHLAYVTNGNALIEANGVAGISIENIMLNEKKMHANLDFYSASAYF